MSAAAVDRDLRALADTTFDLVVIGGGLFGAFAAWDAAQRGLSVALIERGDFGGATSAHSFKIVHGGIRYLQHADVVRLRESSAERRTMLRIAPHLVRPLPIAIPTRGHGMSGRAALKAGLTLYDLLTLDRNRGQGDPSRRLPGGRMLGRREALEAFPDIVGPDATGAGIFHDGQFHNPTRLVWAAVRSAISAGAVVANHVEAVALLRRGDRAEGITVRDARSDARFEIRANAVLNAAGPYAESLLAQWRMPLPESRTYSRDACFVVRRRLLPAGHGVALLGRTRDPDARVSRGARHLFMVPWRDYTLVGVWHRVQRPGSHDISVSTGELEKFIEEINGSAPRLGLEVEDVSRINAGLVPFGDNPEGAEHLRYGHRSSLIDHTGVHGCRNLVTLIGLRLTTARLESQRAIDLIFRQRGENPPPCRTEETPLHGGDIGSWAGLLRSVERDTAGRLRPEIVQSFAANYGSEYRGILALANDGETTTITEAAALRAQVLHAVRHEMARTLADVVLRRTDLGTGAFPGWSALGECAQIVASELGWSAAEREQEIGTVAEAYPGWARGRDTPAVPASLARRTAAVPTGN